MSNMNEISRLESQIAQEQQAMTQLFTQIGQQYYGMHQKNPEGEQAAFVQAIDASQARINAMQEQIDQLSGLVKCPACNAKIPAESVFCTGCGYRLIPEPPVPQGPVCANCGTALSEGQNFCFNCGAKVETPVEETPAVNQCANCGNVLPDGAAFCVHCGTPVGGVQTPAKRLCVNCGGEVPDGAVFCILCGTKQ